MSPTKPNKPCRVPWCSALVPSGTTYCPTHRRQMDREQGRTRPTSKAQGFDGRWTAYARFYLTQHPLCCRCLEETRLPVPATEVHHRIPFHGDRALQYDESNLMALCHRCHSKVTATTGRRWG